MGESVTGGLSGSSSLKCLSVSELLLKVPISSQDEWRDCQYVSQCML